MGLFTTVSIIQSATKYIFSCLELTFYFFRACFYGWGSSFFPGATIGRIRQSRENPPPLGPDNDAGEQRLFAVLIPFFARIFRDRPGEGKKMAVESEGCPEEMQ
jgi:hypothetical protein